MRAKLYIGVAMALAGSTAFASEGDGGLGKALITPEIGTFFWTLVTFLFMMAILARYAWKPLLGAVQSREQSIRDSLEEARREREEASALLAKHEELVNQARRERSEALSQGQRDAEKLKDEILEEARRQREQRLKQTEQQVDAALRQAKGELRSFATDLAIQAAGKLLSRNLDAAAQRKVVEDYLTDLEKSGNRQPPMPS